MKFRCVGGAINWPRLHICSEEQKQDDGQKLMKMKMKIRMKIMIVMKIKIKRKMMMSSSVYQCLRGLR